MKMKRVHPTPHAKAPKASPAKTKPDTQFPRASQLAPANPGRSNIANHGLQDGERYTINDNRTGTSRTSGAQLARS
jgi:hypothetical protein